MNVRERAKQYDAFMSSGSAPSPGHADERKKSGDELLNSQVSQGTKPKGSPEQKTLVEKAKPVPPSRKPKRDVPRRPERGPVLQGKSSPPPMAKHPSPKARTTAANEQSKPKQPPPRPVPSKRHTMSSVAVTPKPYTKPDSSHSSTLTRTRSSSRENDVTSAGSPPKRPPPASSRTSSLPRKSRPPVPPKPKTVANRIGSPSLTGRKSATLPKSLSPKNEQPTSAMLPKAGPPSKEEITSENGIDHVSDDISILTSEREVSPANQTHSAKDVVIVATSVTPSDMEIPLECVKEAEAVSDKNNKTVDGEGKVEVTVIEGICKPIVNGISENKSDIEEHANKELLDNVEQGRVKDDSNSDINEPSTLGLINNAGLLDKSAQHEEVQNDDIANDDSLLEKTSKHEELIRPERLSVQDQTENLLSLNDDTKEEHGIDHSNQGTENSSKDEITEKHSSPEDEFNLIPESIHYEVREQSKSEMSTVLSESLHESVPEVDNGDQNEWKISGLSEEIDVTHLSKDDNEVEEENTQMQEVEVELIHRSEDNDQQPDELNRSVSPDIQEKIPKQKEAEQDTELTVNEKQGEKEDIFQESDLHEESEDRSENQGHDIDLQEDSQDKRSLRGSNIYENISLQYNAQSKEEPSEMIVVSDEEVKEDLLAAQDKLTERPEVSNTETNEVSTPSDILALDDAVAPMDSQKGLSALQEELTELPEVPVTASHDVPTPIDSVRNSNAYENVTLELVMVKAGDTSEEDTLEMEEGPTSSHEVSSPGDIITLDDGDTPMDNQNVSKGSSVLQEELTGLPEVASTATHEVSNPSDNVRKSNAYENVSLELVGLKSEGTLEEDAPVVEEDPTSPQPVPPARTKRGIKQPQKQDYDNVDLLEGKEETKEDDIPQKSISSEKPTSPVHSSRNSYENVIIVSSISNEEQIETKPQRTLPSRPPPVSPTATSAAVQQTQEMPQSAAESEETRLVSDTEYQVPRSPTRKAFTENDSQTGKGKHPAPPRPAPYNKQVLQQLSGTDASTPDEEQLYVVPRQLNKELAVEEESGYQVPLSRKEECSLPKQSQKHTPPPRPAPYNKPAVSPESVASVVASEIFTNDEQVYRVPSPLSRAPTETVQSEDHVSDVTTGKHMPPPRPAPYKKEDLPPSPIASGESSIVIDEQVYVVPSSLLKDEGAAGNDAQKSPTKGQQYENVNISLKEEKTQSFQSESPPADEAHKARSLSVGSTSSQGHSEYEVPKARSATVGEQVCVAPRAPPVCERKPVEGPEYYVHKTHIKEESLPECIESSGITTADLSNKEVVEEAVYAVPRSEPVSPSEILDNEKASPATEDVYAVPRSPSPSRMDAEQEASEVRERTASEDIYAKPSSPISSSTEDPLSAAVEDAESYSVPKRSSVVVTCRSQLPDSFKRGPPPKPPRSRESTSGIEERATSEPSPESIKEIPEPKPVPSPRSRHNKKTQVESTIEIKDEEPEGISPMPKRPAPPRPRAPSLDPTKGVTEESEKNEKKPKHHAPQRPPPPSNRTSIMEGEQEPASPLPVIGDSSDSDSDVEHVQLPQRPTGPPRKKTYHITHEILSTERTFVEALRLAYEDCYGNVKKAEVVPESTLNEIFKDLGNIYQLDWKFLQELEERMTTWEEHERIGDIVKKYGHFLKMYTTYINNYDKAATVLQETMKENPQFVELVLQFQSSEKCRGLQLNSFMLKPVQRIPSYRLLLIDYLKHLSQDSAEYQDIKVALDIVSEVATHINESMKRVDNFEQVLRIQGSLVGHEEIVKPGREFIKQGLLMKLCRKDMQERMFFLLTDVLLYTAPVGGNQYKLKETLPLLGMKVMLPESQDFENEFSIISTTRSFTLSASTPVERDEWLEELENAISAMTKKKISFFKTKEGTLAKPEAEEETKLGAKAPVWIPDARVTMCMLCTEKFTVTNRRHHCRGCGKVVCGSCSDTLAPLAYLDYAQARVCEHCYDVLLVEQNKEAVTEVKDIAPLPSMAGDTESLDRIHRKPAKFEILHRFKPGSTKKHNRKSKLFRPSVCTEVVGNESGSQVSGYLRCKRPSKHGWKRLWFVLKDNVLYTYKASEDVVAQETIPVLGYEVEESKKDGEEIVFQLRHKGLPPIYFKTDSESSAMRWTQELKKATTL